MRVDSVGRRRDSKTSSGNKAGDMSNNVMNQMMVSNMYQQGSIFLQFLWSILLKVYNDRFSFCTNILNIDDLMSETHYFSN